MVFEGEQIMNLGFYVENNGGSPENTEIYNFLNEQIKESNLKDASVFFNSVNFNPVQTKFGMFDGADVWNFTGTLIATSLDNAVKAKKVVNKSKVAYLYNGQKQNVFQLTGVANMMPVIVRDEAAAAEFRRVTGKEPVLMEKLNVDKIREIHND